MALLVASGLVVYNGLLNRWAPFHRHAYVPVNIAFGALLVGLSLTVFGLDSFDLGLVWDGMGLTAGAIGGVALASPLFLFARDPRQARRIADRRIAGLSSGELLYRVTIRIPVGTALFEETIFRGVLLALGLVQGTLFGWMVSSFAFGLWHVAPSLNLIEINRPSSAHSIRWRTAALAVVITGIGGIFFLALRVLTGSLAAPVGFHAALNSTASVAAYLAHRRLARENLA